MSFGDFCQRDGDADILGLGVRVGMYCSSLALLLAFWKAKSLPEMKDAMLSSVPIIFSVLYVLSAQAVAGTVTDFGFLSALYVLSSYFVGMSVPLAWYMVVADSDPDVVPGFTAFICCGANIWCLVLQMWFWVSGYRYLHNFECGTTWAFMFARVDTAGWFRTLSLVSIAMAFANTFFSYACFWKRWRNNGDKGRPAPVEAEEPCEGLLLLAKVSLLMAQWLRNKEVFVWLGLITGLICGTGAELTMHWNSMQGIYTIVGTGQTLALVAGIVTLIIAVRETVTACYLWIVASLPPALPCAPLWPPAAASTPPSSKPGIVAEKGAKVASDIEAGVGKVPQQAGGIVRSASGKLSPASFSKRLQDSLAGMPPPGGGEVDKAGRGHEHGPHDGHVQQLFPGYWCSDRAPPWVTCTPSGTQIPLKYLLGRDPASKMAWHHPPAGQGAADMS